MTRPIFPIESSRRLAHILGYDKDNLESIASRSVDLYDSLFLVVPGKEPRPIKIPRKELRIVQRRILRRLFSDFIPHPCSFGGVGGRSPRKNAEMHINGLFFLKIDVRKFYPSIHHRWINNYFNTRLGCSPPVSRILRRLVTLDAGLPQGTCTSPMLADQLMKPIDRILASVFHNEGVTYSRFVDDMTISAPFRLRRYLPLLGRVLKSFGLCLHPSKIEEVLPNSEAVVTGFSCRKRIGLSSSYILQVESELKRALEYSKSLEGMPPQFCRESYWGAINYVRRYDSASGRLLRNVFSNVRWSAISELELPTKRGKLVKTL